jgi:DNA-directed RNA polymerase specialized sigma24 family protein
VEQSRLRAALNGDRAARVELGRWISRELSAFFLVKKKYPKVVAYDLVQSTAVALVKKLDEAPDDPAKFQRWMIGFAKMQILSDAEKIRRERARIEILQRRRAQPSTSVGSLMFMQRVRSKQLELLDWAIAQLPKNLREAIEDYLDERERKSIAATRGIKVRSVDRAIWEAINALRNLVRLRRLTPPSTPASS